MKDKKAEYRIEIERAFNNVKDSKKFWAAIKKFWPCNSSVIPPPIRMWNEYYRHIYIAKSPSDFVTGIPGDEGLDGEFTLPEL